MDKQTEQYLLNEIQKLSNQVRYLTTNINELRDTTHQNEKAWYSTLSKEQREGLPIDYHS